MRDSNNIRDEGPFLNTRYWEQDWKRWINDMEFKYKYLVEIILKQRRQIAELKEEVRAYRGN